MRLLLLFFCLSIGVGAFSQAQNSCLQAKKIVDAINLRHLEPRPIDDSLSARIFHGFFKLLNEEGDCISSNDIKNLYPLRFELDDQINKNSCDFLTVAAKLFTKKLIATRNSTDSLLKKALNYQLEEFYSINPLEKSRFVSEVERKKKLQAEIKLDILSLLYRKYKESGLSVLDEQSFNKLEGEARLRVKSKRLNGLNRLIKNQSSIDSLVANCFLKAIAKAFDPHTEYFSSEEIKEFESALSQEESSFGFDVDENKIGEITIARLIPGGAAWNSNQLHAGDVLLEIDGGDKKKYDILDYDEEEVKDILRSSALKNVKIKVRKGNGEEAFVSLIKSKVENSENLVSSFVLKGEKKIGYINLPGFFMDMENQSTKGCADEVTKEILKLKTENIEGLILDLRFNGGGSMSEAIELAGVFVDVGPLAIVQEHNKAPAVLKDINKGQAYTGPLAIMVNEASASASELVAAALQDYNRAVIIGTNTYGKATGQAVFPVTNNINEDGFVKVTIERIYRVTGASIQQAGVLPDFRLPDILESWIEKEKALPYSFPSQSVAKKVYYTPLPFYPFTPQKELSKARIELSPKFSSVEKLYNSFLAPIPLEKNAFFKFNENIKTLTNELDDITSLPYEILNSNLNNSLFAVDEYHEAVNKQSKDAIKKSFNVQEAYSILKDIINSKTK